ncbi:hypothetical protein RHMOL_Rhmol13G0041600 [Rhododendron molle]|uniref:Uncharacterized protein n=1 Tax=Rhododendron molle TaxID=49168 RepID=A0ACC0L4B2_RHOML|nr:hypothetical protein RHMOL_Rhmol13G0041600 [Rhododendron molle]
MDIGSALPRPQLGPPACEKHAKALQFIEEVTRNAESVQQKVLEEILSANAETEYLRRFRLSGSTDRDTFKSEVPVVTYEELQPEIQRIVEGDRSPILSVHPITELFTSSGTSGGQRKLIPTTKVEMDRRDILTNLRMPVMSLYVPDLDKGKGLYFMFLMSETKTPGGLLARTVFTSHLKSAHFQARRNDPYDLYTSPDEAIQCPNMFQSMYTQMLCGLLEHKQVHRVGAVLASALLRAIRFLQLNWPQLTHDIRSGTFNPAITDPSIRDCMIRILKKPEPKLADFIASECSKESWEKIITRIWPNTKYLDCIVSGVMAQYITALEYFSGGLPIASTSYGSSECYVGLNLNPICDPYQVIYTIMPNMAYFEFIPQKSNSTELVDLADVEVGQEYELVVTTYGGLYRYRIGDILRVTGFHNSAPQVYFVSRKNVLLSIDADKTDEAELQKSVETAGRLLRDESGATVLDYTSDTDTKSTFPGHYVIYWELAAPDSACWPSDELLGRCCLAMEESLGHFYKQSRVADRSIGPLEIRVVRSGTFEEIMNYAISRGASINQYKVPRCVSLAPMRKLLESRVASAHFSPSLPHWSPEPSQ